MLEKILRLGKETAIYGLSTVVGRLLNFLIVPFYANVLLPAENGIISNIYAYIAFAFVIYCYGMEAAYMRFVSSLELGTKKQNFSAPFLSLALTSVLLSLAIHVQAAPLARIIGIDPVHRSLIQYAGWILCFDTLTIVPFAALRMDQRPKRFAALKLFNISANLVLNLVFILGLRMRAEGVLLANLCASVFTFVLMSGLVFRQLTFRFPMMLLKEILQFGIPYVPAGLAGIAMQVIDRPIVKALTNDTTLGIYQLNYRLGIFMMLIVSMFDYAWRPFFLSHAQDADAKSLFAKVFTYFAIAAMSIFLMVSLFIEDVVRMNFFGRHFFPQTYWQGVHIVPWVLLAYVFTGAYVIFIVGVYLKKKTKYLPLVSGFGALVNVGANFLLIPKIGILGAALSTLCSYVVMAVGMYFASQRFYRVEYEWSKVIKVACSALFLFFVFEKLHLVPLTAWSFCIKVLLLSAFVVSIRILRIVDTSELGHLKSLVKRLVPGSNGAQAA